jgi:putative membrane protein
MTAYDGRYRLSADRATGNPMARPFLTSESKTALSEAVRAVESCSSAELVVAVRPRSGSYLYADLIFGILTGLAALAILLYSRWEFELVWFLVDPVLVAALAGFAASRSDVLRRVFTRPATRRLRVETAARSTFVERRIHGTMGRTGILLYVSVLEREAAFVVDVGVEALAATDAWRTAVREIEEAVRHGADGTVVAARLRDLAALLSPALERGHEDVDELPNEVC